MVNSGRRARDLAIALCLFSLSSASWAQEAWFRITGPNGATIGWQHESEVVDAARTRRITERQMVYRVDGHEPVRQLVRRATLRDAASQIVEQTLEIGADAASLRSIDPRIITDEVPLAAILVAASDSEGSARSEDLRVVSRLDGQVIVARIRDGSFDHAWRVKLSSNGAPPAIVQPMLGAALTFTLSGSLGEADISPKAVIPHPMIASPYDITSTARRGHMRYRFGLPAGLPLKLPTTAEQRFSRNGDELTLDVCADCGIVSVDDPDELSRWRRPSPWIESDLPELRLAAARARRPNLSEAQVIVKLGEIARERLSGIDYQGHLSARHAWKRRKGDCTEDAVLVAALARAAGFPARVASGLVYDRERFHGTRDAFLPHAWTLVWTNGAWRSVDISSGAFDATHIAMAVGDGEPETITLGWRIAALLKWHSMAEVRSALPNPSEDRRSEQAVTQPAPR